MKLKIICWNVKGVNNLDKRKVIKTFLRAQRADLLCMQETKIQQMNCALARSIGVSRFFYWRALSAEGVAGGHCPSLG